MQQPPVRQFDQLPAGIAEQDRTAEVDRIECDNREARFTIEDAKRIKAEYKAKLAELKKRQP
jgi:hypothetical protein